MQWINEGKKRKGVVPTIIGILGVLTSLILHNATGLWPYIITFSLLLLLSDLLYRRTNRTDHSYIKKVILVFVLFSTLSCNPPPPSEQENNQIQEIYLLDKNRDSYVEFYSTDINDFFHPEKSNRYPSVNLFDGYFKTCWVAGNSKNKKQAALYIKIPKNLDLDKVILNVFSGYGKSKDLYYKNSRPKKIKISIFAAFAPEGYATEVADLFLINKWNEEKIIDLADTFGVQSFPLHFDKKRLRDFQNRTLKACYSFSGNQYKSDFHQPDKFIPGFIIQLEIMNTYQGSSDNDICISEIFFNDRFITAYPDKYRQINDVYIENDNTLMMDCAGENSIVIYKDTSSVFTMVDWVKNSNWAILHYVPKSSADQTGRVEELYSLVDLKNNRLVDKDFEKYTGYNLMFGIIEKSEDSRVFLDINDNTKVELK